MQFPLDPRKHHISKNKLTKSAQTAGRVLGFSSGMCMNETFYTSDGKNNYRINSCISRSFRTKNSTQRITLNFYTSRAQRPDPSRTRNQHNNCLKSVSKTEFIKPVRIHSVRVSSLFSAFFVHKKFEIINFEWLDTKLLELTYIVSSGLQNRHFSLQLRLCLQCRTFDFIERLRQLSNLANAIVSRSLAR